MAWWEKYEKTAPSAPAKPTAGAGKAPWWTKYEGDAAEPAAADAAPDGMWRTSAGELVPAWTTPPREAGEAIGAGMAKVNAGREAAARPVYLSDFDWLSPPERARVITLAEKARGDTGMALPGEATYIPGETDDETARFTSAVQTLEALRKSRAPQMPGDEFVRTIGLGQQAPAPERAPEPVDNPITQSFAGQLAQQVGGVAQMVGEGLADTRRFLGSSSLEPTAIDRALQGLEDIGRDVYGQGSAMAAEAAASMAPRPEDLMRDPLGAARYFGEQALAGSGATIVGMGAGAINPALGAAVMSGGAAGQKFAEARQEGQSIGDALRGAGVAAAAEYGPEKLSLDVAFGKLSKYLGGAAADRFTGTLAGRMAAAGVAEPTTEMVTEAINIAYETYGENKPFDLAEAQRRILDSGIIGGITGVAMGGAAAAPGSAMAAVRERQERARSEAEASSARMRQAIGSLLPGSNTASEAHAVFAAARDSSSVKLGVPETGPFTIPVPMFPVSMPQQPTTVEQQQAPQVSMATAPRAAPATQPAQPAMRPDVGAQNEPPPAAQPAPQRPTFVPRRAPTEQDIEAQNAEVDAALAEFNRTRTDRPEILSSRRVDSASPQARADAQAIGAAPVVDFYAEPSSTGAEVQDFQGDLTPEELAAFGLLPAQKEGDLPPIPTTAPDGRKWGDAPAAAKPDFLALTPQERAAFGGEIADAFSEMAKAPEARQLPTPPPSVRSFEELLRAFDPAASVAVSVPPSGNKTYTITSADGRTAKLVEEPGRVLQLDASDYLEGSSGGAGLYAAVNTYAQRNGLLAAPDRQGLTEINKTRRTEHQAASALRTGTTKHLIPDITQAVAGFDVGGNDRANTGALIMKGVWNTLRAVPDLAFLRYNQETGQIEWTDGTPATNEDLDAIARTDAAREAGVGRSTIKRAVLGSTWIRSLRQGERGRVLGQLGRESIQRLEAPAADPRLSQANARQLLYSRQVGGQNGESVASAGPADAAGRGVNAGDAGANVPTAGGPATAAAGVDGGRGRVSGAAQPQAAAARDAGAASNAARPAPGAIRTGLTREQVIGAASASIGQKAMRRLLGQPWMHIVESRADLPADIRDALEPGYLQGGLFLPGSSDVWLIADEISSDPAGVLLHEVGVHYGWRNVLGERGARLMQQFEALRGKDAKVDAAFKAALDAGALPEQLVEEALGHYVEMNAASRDGLIARVIDAIRDFLNRLGVPMGTISPEMLVAVARGAAQQAAQTPRANQGARNEERQGREGQGRREGRSPLLRAPQIAESMASRVPEPSKPPRPFETSTKNAVTRAEISASELLKKAAPGPAPEEHHQQVLDEALARVKSDPNLIRETMARLAAGTSRAISVADEAVLLVGKAQLMLQRDRYADEALSDRVSTEDAAVARRLFDETEAVLAEMNAATMASGREWGRFGAFRQRMLRQDFSFANLTRRAQIAKGGPLTLEETARLKVDAERVAQKEEELQQAEKKRDDLLAADEVRSTYVNIVKQIAAEAKAARKKKTPLRDYFTAMAEDAYAALDALPSVKKSKETGAVQLAMLPILTKIFTAEVALTGIAVADWTVENTKAIINKVKTKLGPRWNSDFDDASKDAMGAALAAVESVAELEREVSPEDTREEILADLAKGGDPEELTHRDIYDLARAHILAGVRGENNVMKAVHEDLKRVYPEITEREVRVKFSEYGKAVFPNKDLDRVLLRELRAMVQMQESITRLEEGKAPLRSGMQRDKPTLPVREKRAKLNDMLKAAQAKDANPERLATYQEMRERNLRNMLEEYKKQLETGERPVRREPPPPSQAMVDLKKQIDEVKTKIRAIDEAGKPKESPEARALRLEEERLARRLADMEALRQADWKRAQATPAPKPSSEATTALKAKIKALEDEYAAVRRARRPRRSKEDRANEARRKALLRRIEQLNTELLTKIRPAKGAPLPSSKEVQALAAVRDDLLKKVMEQRRGPELTDQQKWEQKTLARLKTERSKLEARIAAEDYEPRKPKLREATAEIVKLRSEVKQAKIQIATRFLELEMAKRGPVGKFLAWTSQTLHLSRAIMTSMDFSAVLRQGGFIALGHPVRAARIMWTMFHSFVSQKVADKAIDDLKARPYFQYYEKAGLELTDVDGADLTRLEEQFMSRWIQKLEMVPNQEVKNRLRTARNWLTAPIRGSGRAFVTFLNILRADTFDAMTASLSKNERKPTLEEMKAVANYVNIATGRGKIGMTHKQAMTGLNHVFFAPRLVASRFNLLFVQPIWGGDVSMRESGLRVRALIAAEYARFLLGVSTALGLAALIMGDDDDDQKGLVSLDPRNTDFLKVRFGDQYFDPLTGLAQVTVFATRMLGGETVTADGTVVPLRNAGTLWRLSDLMGDEDIGDVKFGKPATGDVLWRFLRTKLAPLPSAILNVAAGSDVVGQPVTPADAALGMFMPISAGDIVNVWRKEGIEGGLPFTVLSMLGVGTQYREPRDEEN